MSEGLDTARRLHQLDFLRFLLLSTIFGGINQGGAPQRRQGLWCPLLP